MSNKNGFQCGIDLGNDEHDVAFTTRDEGRMAPRSGRDVRRKPRPAARVGGMHCRRSKRWTWGHGQAARLSDVMAFARCLACVVALASSAAMADEFTWVTVGNPGNPGNPGNNNFGAVAYSYQISALETTNAQYTAFLNEADPTGLNARLLYNVVMGSDVNGGITNTGTSGAVYAVKPGFANVPVNFVSWHSAARFVNWLTTGGTSTETGSYDLANLGAGRLASAIYVLPSFDEYYKAAFYTGSGSTYTLYQTNSDTTPTASGVGSASGNTAIYGGAAAAPPATGPIAVGSFANSKSFFGLLDALGNVTEYTDNLNGTGTQATRVGGNWNMDSSLLASVNANAAPGFGPLNTANSTTGFRVAMVPEPGAISLAIMGGLALLGAGTVKRWRKAGAAASVN